MNFVKTEGNGPERIKVEMLDPIMTPGSSRTAVAPITAKPANMACEAELWLGPNETTKVVTSGRKAFTATGSAQSVRLPVVMPVNGGSAYNVYLDCYANGMRFLAYAATEQVVVPGGSIGPITWE